MSNKPLHVQNRWVAASLLALAALCPGPTTAESPPPFDNHSKRITNTNAFGTHTEGPAVDAEGNLYAVNFVKDGTIGKLPTGETQFVTLTTLADGQVGNGIRIDRNGRMFIADFKGHQVLIIPRGETTARTYFKPASPRFHQPNDLAIASDGTLYASDPVFPPNPSGRIWRITPATEDKGQGAPMISDERPFGSTNGLDLSPDGTTLYVSESDKHEVWAYRIDGDHLRDPRKVFHFPDKDVDGLRTDVDGRIYVARPEKGVVAIIKPAANGTDPGTLVRTVMMTAEDPTNLTFGGPDGRTVFVTNMKGRFVESFRTDRPGREPCMQTQAPGMC